MSDKLTGNIVSIIYDSLVNGPDMRTAIFFQGCSIHCKGCHNKHTWEFNTGRDMTVDEILKCIENNSFTKNITLTGGHPLEQKEFCLELVKELKKKEYNICIYTGWIYEDIKDEYKDILDNIDYLIDGPFKQYLHMEGLKYKGSSNQRIIDMNKTRELKEVILYAV